MCTEQKESCTGTPAAGSTKRSTFQQYASRPAAAKRGLRLPVPGQRIVRSVFSIWVCMGIYYLRGMRGAPFYSIIAALQCIQPYTENIVKVGSNRIRGTLIGAFWGGIALLLELYAAGGQLEETLLHYLLLGLFSGLVLYSTVVLKVTESAYFSTVVFLSIFMNHITDENPWLYVFDRTLDTIIGVGVALLICALHLPRLRDRDTLFVSGIDHVLFRTDRRMSPLTRVQLNRFLADGMRFSVSTKQTPATVRETLQGIHLRLPIIAMDGAVLYDLGTGKYLVTRKMTQELASLVTDFLHGEHMPFFVNTVQDDLLVIYYRSFQAPGNAPDSAPSTRKNVSGCFFDQTPGNAPGRAPSTPPGNSGSPSAPPDHAVENNSAGSDAYAAMHRLYLKKKASPYRNYLQTDTDVTDNVLYFLMIDKKERIDSLEKALRSQPWAGECRAAFDTFDCEEGERILRIYAAGATRAAMLEDLRQYVGADRVITFGNTPGACDVLIPDAGGGHMVRELKKRFEPVSLRGWRNILRL